MPNPHRRFDVELGLEKSSYEYGMLYGISTAEQTRLARGGHKVRVLISYGSAWFPWYMRRLAERPANLWFVAKQIVRGG
jgi:proline dehydrogenase